MDKFRITQGEMLAALPIRFYPKLRAGQVLTNATARFECHSQHNPAGFMPLGAFSYSHSVFEAASIGRYCSISGNVRVMGAGHPVDWVSTSPVHYQPRRRRLFGLPPLPETARFDGTTRPVTIGHDVWIGQDVLLRGGVTIGTGAVIGAGAVVTRDVAPYCVMGGNPARLLRPRFAPEISQALLDSAWWMADPACLTDLPFDRPEAFLTALQSRGPLPQMAEDRMTIHEMIARFGGDEAALSQVTGD